MRVEADAESIRLFFLRLVLFRSAPHRRVRLLGGGRDPVGEIVEIAAAIVREELVLVVEGAGDDQLPRGYLCGRFTAESTIHFHHTGTLHGGRAGVGTLSCHSYAGTHDETLTGRKRANFDKQARPVRRRALIGELATGVEGVVRMMISSHDK